MYNVFLDKLPNNFKGYLINTDFRIGIQILQIFSDADLDEMEKSAIALNLLYGNGVPDDRNMAIAGLFWFLNCGKERNNEESNDDDIIFDFDIDAHVIYSAFYHRYNIDLKTAKLHWWDFKTLLLDLGECALTNIMNARQTKITPNMPQEEQEYYRKLKKIYEIPKQYTTEETNNLNEFLAQLKGGEDDTI